MLVLSFRTNNATKIPRLLFLSKRKLFENWKRPNFRIQSLKMHFFQNELVFTPLQEKSRGKEEGGNMMVMQRGAKMDEAIFREKLKNMGQKSKRKFSQLAGMFSRRKGAKQLLNQTPDDNLLLNDEPFVQVNNLTVHKIPE